MRITITTQTGQLFNLDVLPDEEVLNVKVLTQVETQVPFEEIQLFFNGRELSDQTKLNEANIRENDVLMVERKVAKGSFDIGQLASTIAAGLGKRSTPSLSAHAPAGAGPRAVPRGPSPSVFNQESEDPTDPSVFRSYVMSDPNLLTNLLHNDRDLAEAILSDDNFLLESILRERARQKQLEERRKFAEIERLNADPLNIEAQAAIAGKIQEENILENMETAMEHHPEAFGRVVMLYINVEVNGVPIKAFVDSGAQQTIMSVECAERCGIMRLVDKRWSGIAQGVGTAKIMGRVHLAPIKIGNSFFPCSFTILIGQNLEFLLGLDMLRRHQCVIDLKDTVLRIQNEVVGFLSEKDIPESEKNQKLTEEQARQLDEDMVEQGIAVSTKPPTGTTTKTTTDTATATAAEKIPKSTGSSVPVTPVPAHAGNSPWSESTIQNLISLGYSRPQVIEALSMCNGNSEMAASYLFSTMFG